MARLDENSLICDLAETYHVLNWRTLPATLAATLAAGLREDARIMLKISGNSVSPNTLLLASTADAVRLLVWQQTKDGVKGKNAPESFVALLSGAAAEKEQSRCGFDSPEEFRTWRNSVLGGDADA